MTKFVQSRSEILQILDSVLWRNVGEEARRMIQKVETLIHDLARASDSCRPVVPSVQRSDKLRGVCLNLYATVEC